MKIKKITLVALMFGTIAFALPVMASPSLACSTGGGHTCSLHNPQNQHVGDHCQCDGSAGHHSVQGTVVNLICSTHNGHSCSTRSHHVGAQCGCIDNGHEVRGVVTIDYRSYHNNPHQNQYNNNRNINH